MDDPNDPLDLIVRDFMPRLESGLYHLETMQRLGFAASTRMFILAKYYQQPMLEPSRKDFSQ